MQLTTLVALALAGMAAAKSPMHLKERVNAPDVWVRRGPAPDSHMLDLRFGLKQRAMADLEEKLLEISDPDSKTYGKWLNKEDVQSYMQPKAESTAAVKRWLAEHGIEEQLHKRSAAGDWMAAHMTVEQARDVLGADFAIWVHRETGEQLIRTTEYSVPRDVNEHIDLVSPTTYFRTIRSLTSHSSGLKMEPLSKDFNPIAGLQRISSKHNAVHSPNGHTKHPHPSNDGVPASCNATAVTMTCLRQYYGTYDYKVQSKDKQFIGVSGFLEQYANYDDLRKFESTQRVDAARANYTFDLVKLDGGLNTQSMPGAEANLDVQTVAGIAFPIPETYYSVGGRPPFKKDLFTPTNTNEPYSTEFEYLLTLSDDKLPSIQSTSYGDDEQTVPVAYQRRVCHEAAALGARGMTLLFSSGDSGVGPDNKCVSNDGKKTKKFLPAFPASCPYVTTVGGTQNFAPERAVGPSFYGGGGFSETWPMPRYQKSVVPAYVDSLNGKYKGRYNPKGRAYPDLSAQSLDFVIVIDGNYARISGTSASTPLTAGILGLINDKRLTAGKSTLGFINPALYKGAGKKGLRDITVGSNKGCNTDGFPATKGWDAATGFGTPDFAKLSKVFA